MIDHSPPRIEAAPPKAAIPGASNTRGDLCQLLEWDTQFFGVPIGSIIPHRLTEASVREALLWAVANKTRCLYMLADSEDCSTLRLAEVNKFQLVDIRLTLARNNIHSPTPPFDKLIRHVKAEDIPSLREIAGVSHRDSRFYSDPNFPLPLVDELYRTWIEKSCLGYAAAVLVAEHEGRAVGYITCHLDGQGIGRIGLLGVSSVAQGQGIGTKLVASALGWFEAQAVGKVTVVTQGRNVSAQRLYQRCGFITESLQLWYHRWFSATGE